MPYRAIEVKHCANKGKVQKIKSLFKPAKQTAKAIARYQWELFFKTGSFNRKANIKHIQSKLSERYKYTIQYHLVVPTLESFVSNLLNRFVEVVLNSTLEEKTKKVLLYLASKQEIFCRKSQTANWKAEKLEITDYERLLSRKIFKHILSKYKKPSFRNNTLILDSKCALEKQKNKG